MKMSDSEYQIRVKRGHHSRLRFWFDPMNDKILNGDADLIYPDELSCDKLISHDLFLPFVVKYFPGEFLFKTELNLMPLNNVKEMVKEVRACIALLEEEDLDNPRLDLIREGLTLENLVSNDEYDEKYEALEEKYNALEEQLAEKDSLLSEKDSLLSEKEQEILKLKAQLTELQNK